MPIVKIKDIEDVDQALALLGAEILPVKWAWRVGKVRRQLRGEIEQKTEKLNAILRKHGSVGKDGTYQIMPDSPGYDLAREDLKELLDTVIDVPDSDTFALSELQREFEKDPPPQLGNIYAGLGTMLVVDQDPSIEPTALERRQTRRKRSRQREG